jgi:thioredoxin 1
MKNEKKKAKYFTAAWCGPCRMYAPVVEELVTEGYDIEKINVDVEMDMAQQYGIMSVPTIVVENSEGVVDVLMGVYPKEEIAQRLS